MLFLVVYLEVDRRLLRVICAQGNERVGCQYGEMDNMWKYVEIWRNVQYVGGETK